tara:strand:+ start:24 stop:266 length:243 start_codon:yes stop_codon:yes gene_type:complete
MAEKLYRARPEGRVEIPEDEAAEIRAEWAANKAEQEATKYSRDRQSAYPNWPDQLDQIYHEGIDAWKVSIKKIKDDNPKP